MKFDAPGAKMRMAKLKLSGECGVLRWFVKVCQRAGTGSTIRVKGK